MGLDSVLKYMNPETGQYEDNLPMDIAKEIRTSCSNIMGIQSESPTFVSFRGKAYAYVVKQIANTNLYWDLNTEQIKKVHEQFHKFVESHQERFSELDQVYESDGWQINDWVELITEEYVPEPKEIAQLEKLFGICVKYNLMIYASY